MKTEVLVTVWTDNADTEQDSPVLTVMSENGETELQSYTVVGSDGEERILTDFELEEVAAIAVDALRRCTNEVASMPLTREETNYAIQSEDCRTNAVSEASEPDAD